MVGVWPRRANRLRFYPSYVEKPPLKLFKNIHFGAPEHLKVRYDRRQKCRSQKAGGALAVG